MFLRLQQADMDRRATCIVRLADMGRFDGCAAYAVPGLAVRTFADIKKNTLCFVIYELCINPFSAEFSASFHNRDFDAVAAVPGSERRTGKFGIGASATDGH